MASTTPKATRVATPWGAANVVERVTVPQRAGEQRFASFVELLETGGGERLVRFAYSTAGVGRRGPVTLRARDVERLQKELGAAPALAALLGSVIGAPAREAPPSEAPPSEAAREEAGPRRPACYPTAASDRAAAASTSEPRISAPSVDPRSGSTACSGWGISPKTLPSAFTTPATSATAPLGLAPSA